MFFLLAIPEASTDCWPAWIGTNVQAPIQALDYNANR